MFSKVLLCLFFVGYALAQEYSDDQNVNEQQYSPSYARQGYNADLYETARAEPYDFGFQSTDEFGTIMNRQESSDSNGAVRGSYGYTDPFGVFRHVDYVADEFGFRAEVKSNEPGMGTQSPANVQIYAEPPPAGVIVERPYYHPHGHHQGGQGGQSAAQQPARRNPSAAGSNQSRQVRPVSGSRATGSSSGSRVAVYPYVPPQQNAFSSNALSSNQYSQTVSNQYPQTVSSQYPQTVSSQYAANSAAASASGSQYSSDASYQASASGFQPSRNAYSDSQSYSSQTATQLRGATGSSSASSAQQPIVAKPYDGPTYKVGNPHVTDLRRTDRQESGSILLPSVLTTGGHQTTLVKHIHTYPAAPQ